MTDIALIKKDDIINFDMIAPGIYGDQYKAALVSGIVDYNTARLIDPSIDVKHANFYPFFKDKVDNVNSPSIYNYFILQLDKTKSNLVVIGFPWINVDSLVTITTRNATVLIQNFQEWQRAPLVDFLNSLNVTYTYKVDDQ
ncbi:hypothetical protein AH04_60 [Erwinia phage AH04]|uniref:SH3 fold domain-containing protein n=1 Tax=Erwinia phage AH04 TaxID=2869569 RepID=A0AAE8BQ23_9CAUD|nr:hypothetical protein PQC02_gp254 [Erwinia phage AH04]QZA70543.1 hypothetical protein AH04_60 [Erwinia phage AH04]